MARRSLPGSSPRFPAVARTSIRDSASRVGRPFSSHNGFQELSRYRISMSGCTSLNLPHRIAGWRPRSTRRRNASFSSSRAVMARSSGIISSASSRAGMASKLAPKVSFPDDRSGARAPGGRTRARPAHRQVGASPFSSSDRGRTESRRFAGHRGGSRSGTPRTGMDRAALSGRWGPRRRVRRHHPGNPAAAGCSIRWTAPGPSCAEYRSGAVWSQWSSMRPCSQAPPPTRRSTSPSPRVRAGDAGTTGGGAP